MRFYYLLFSFWLTSYAISAQQVISSTTLPIGYSDNAAPSSQVGTEIINTPTGQSVHFVPNGSFEHVGQFYVAANGVYNASFRATDPVVGFASGATDYFGYAPVGKGTYNGPYLGSGIMGASASNGGAGVGTPTFGNVVLTSTGQFHLAGGMEIFGNLMFSTSSGSGSSIITVADGYRVTFRLGSIPPFTGITGANDANYIDGPAGYYFDFPGAGTQNLLLPLGDSKSPTHPYHPLIISYNEAGLYPPSNMMARYLHTNPLPVNTSSLGPGLSAVSTVGYWKIPGSGQFTSFSVSIPQPEGLGDNPNPANLRLVGWNGSKWIIIGFVGPQAPSGEAGTNLNGYKLAGSIPNHTSLSITALAIGLYNLALPVNLVSFTGVYREGEGTKLNWQTSLETNNDHFEIQRSADAKSFETIGRVAGKGTIEALTDYVFMDSNLPIGTSYYRLKQVDSDGSPHYSSIIAIRYGLDIGPSVLTISPNPVQESLKMSLSNGGQIQSVRIYDGGGRHLRQSSTSDIEVSSLSAGSYLVDVKTTTGQTIRQRFIKQ